jgi:hypothetical protein
LTLKLALRFRFAVPHAGLASIANSWIAGINAGRQQGSKKLKVLTAAGLLRPTQNTNLTGLRDAFAKSCKAKQARRLMRDSADIWLRTCLSTYSRRNTEYPVKYSSQWQDGGQDLVTLQYSAIACRGAWQNRVLQDGLSVKT